MSGHSKWHNIARKKGVVDQQRAKVFTKFAREMAVVIRTSGSADPSVNGKLRDVIAKAKANNVPNDNINRVLQKYASGGAGEDYESIAYEGYGPNGVAVIVEVLTDNRNRAAANVRNAFTKGGGNMGNSGCVSFMFDEKGLIVIDKEEIDMDEEELMMAALDAGAEDFAAEEDSYEITTAPDDFSAVRETLEAAGIPMASAEVTMIPQTYTELTDEEDIKKMNKLLEMLDDDDDVQNTYHNWDE